MSAIFFFFFGKGEPPPPVVEVDDTVAPTYIVRAGFVTPNWTEVSSTYTWEQLASAFTWDELAAGPVPSQDVLGIRANRSAANIFRRLEVGIADFVVDNVTGDYSPDNTAGPHAMRPGQVVTVKAKTAASSIYGIFSGFCDRFETESDPERKTTRIRASDVGRFFRRIVSTDIQVETLQSSLLTVVASDLNLPAGRLAIDNRMGDEIPFGFMDNITAGEALQRILQSGLHHAFINGLGRFQTKNRNFDVFRSPVASYVNSALSFDYALTDERLINDAVITGQPRQEVSAVSTLGFVTGAPQVPASQSITFFLEYIDPENGERGVPVRSLAAVVASQDYLLNQAEDGTGTDVTSASSVSVTPFATTALVSVFNGSGNSAHITKFQLRGNPIRKGAAFLGVALSSSSQAIYGRRSFGIESELIGDVLFAANYATYLVSRFRTPLADITIEERNVFPGILQADLIDAIHIVDSHTGLGSNFLINEMTHAIALDPNGLMHTVRYDCRLLDTKEWFVLDKDPEGKLDNNRELGF